MTVESFQVFVDEFASFVGEQTAVRLITDGAAAHRSTRLKVREELLIEHLPAYSPELNPVERLFKELRKELKNRVFESLEAIEEAVIKAIEPFLKDGSRVKKLTFMVGWIQHQPKLFLYNSYAQFFANRGYAVLQPNFALPATVKDSDRNLRKNLQWGEKCRTI